MSPIPTVQEKQRVQLESHDQERARILKSQEEADPTFKSDGYSHTTEMQKAVADILAEEAKTQ